MPLGDVSIEGIESCWGLIKIGMLVLRFRMDPIMIFGLSDTPYGHQMTAGFSQITLEVIRYE